jgi:hypothetical protein
MIVLFFRCRGVRKVMWWLIFRELVSRVDREIGNTCAKLKPNTIWRSSGYVSLQTVKFTPPAILAAC